MPEGKTVEIQIRTCRNAQNMQNMVLLLTGAIKRGMLLHQSSPLRRMQSKSLIG